VKKGYLALGRTPQGGVGRIRYALPGGCGQNTPSSEEYVKGAELAVERNERTIVRNPKNVEEEIQRGMETRWDLGAAPDRDRNESFSFQTQGTRKGKRSTGLW